VLLLTIVPSMESTVATLSFALFLGLLVLAIAVGLWRVWAGKPPATHTGTVEDITYDPYSHPGHAAKHNWRKAIRRLHQQADDDEDDRD